MIQDTISEAVRNDYLILAFGSRLILKHSHEKHLNTFVSQKMRELARLLVCLRSMYPGFITHLSDAFLPNIFQRMVNAVNSLTEFNPENGLYKIPSLAKKTGAFH